MRIVYFIILFTFVCNYAKNQGLTNSLADMNNVLGAKNLLPNNATNQTVNGVTFTVNDDGSITANGTASANTGFTIALDIDARGMILSGCPDGGSRSTYSLQYTNYVDESFADEGNGITIPLSTNTGLWRVAIWITAQSVVNNLVFKPMLRPASIQDDTYVPYSMTNREMTPYVQAISNPNLLDNPWFTVNQRGQSTYSFNGGYSLDRWNMLSSLESCTVVSNSDKSVTITNPQSRSIYFIENLPLEDLDRLKGKTLTLSADVTAPASNCGRLYAGVSKKVGDWESLCGIDIPSGRNITSVTFTMPTSFSGTVGWYEAACFDIKANKSLTIHSVKLELGTISTLSMDSAPNYQQELAKCQRYFQIIGKKGTNGNGLQVTIGMPYSTSDIWFPMYLPVPMIKTPTIEQITGDWIVTQVGSGSPTLLNPDIGIVGFGDIVDVSNINLGINSTNAFTLNSSYKLATKAGTNDSRIFLSANL